MHGGVATGWDMYAGMHFFNSVVGLHCALGCILLFVGLGPKARQAFDFDVQ